MRGSPDLEFITKTSGMVSPILPDASSVYLLQKMFVLTMSSHSSTCLLSRTCVLLSVPIDSPHDEKDESRYGACDDGGTGGDGRGGSSGEATG
jgi:hypothetical protein